MIIRIAITILVCMCSSLYSATLSKVIDKEVYKTTLGVSNDEVIVGDEKEATFKNKVTFNKWDSESVSIDFTSIVGSAINEGGMTKVQDKGSDVFYYTSSGTDMFKYGLMFESKPTTNTWSFPVSISDNLEFIRPPSVYKEGVVRNAKYIGGYAVKQTTSDVPFGFFYPPKFIDSKDNFVMGRLIIENGQYKIKMPLDFWNNAVYPVKSNDSYESAYGGYALTVDVAENDLIVAGISYVDDTTGWGCSDEDDNTYTVAINTVSWSPYNYEKTGILITYAIAESANAENTVSCSNVADVGISIHIYSGMDTLDPFESVIAYKEGTIRTIHETGELSVSSEEGKLVAFWAQESVASNASTSNGWTLRTEESGHVHHTLDKDFTESGVYTSSITTTGNVRYLSAVVAFNAEVDTEVTKTKEAAIIFR